MKYYSDTKPETYVTSGNDLRIYWNIKQVNVPGFADEQRTQWEANEAVCSVFDNRSQIIEKIIGSLYDTGEEIAFINNKESKPEEYAMYQEFRLLAKSLANGWIENLQ
jgi:predicted Mrr-cat superfamily restriction endonuclease